MPVEFALTQDEAAQLQRPINGQGGFQNLARDLQRAYDPATGNITLEDALLGKVMRYLSYKPGGFEGRMAAAFRREIARLIEK